MFHGGRSTGPKTETCEARQGTAPIRDGKNTKEALDDRACSIRVLAGLEDALYVFNMASTPQTQGRNPKKYVPLHAVEDVLRFATATLFIRRGATGHMKIMSRSTFGFRNFENYRLRLLTHCG